jgi:hypothetical protein
MLTLLVLEHADPVARRFRRPTSHKPVTIAVLNDKSSVFSDAGGVGSVVAAQLAIDDAGGKVRGQPNHPAGPRPPE